MNTRNMKVGFVLSILCMAVVIAKLQEPSSSRQGADTSQAIPTSSDGGHIHAVVDKVAPLPPRDHEDSLREMSAPPVAAVSGPSQTWLTTNQVAAVESAARQLTAIGPHPFREKAKRDVIDSLLAEGDGLQACLNILVNLHDTVATFGDEQAAVRVLALEVVKRAAKEDPSLITRLLGDLSSRLVDLPKWEKGVEFDYRDILYAYLESVPFESIEEDPETFLQVAGHHPKISGILRRFTLQFYDGHVEDERLYPILRAIKEV